MQRLPITNLPNMHTTSQLITCNKQNPTIIREVKIKNNLA
jgi:hypothetical protein